MGKPQVGDIGTKIRYNAQESLADHIEDGLKLKYRKPDGTTGEWIAVVYSDTYAEYTTLLATDLNIAGSWSLQIYIETAAWIGHSEIKEFSVNPNIIIPEV